MPGAYGPRRWRRLWPVGHTFAWSAVLDLPIVGLTSYLSCQPGGPIFALLMLAAAQTTAFMMLTAAAVAEKREHHAPRWVREFGRDTLVAGTPAYVVAHFARLAGAGLPYFIAFVYGKDVEIVRRSATAPPIS